MWAALPKKRSPTIPRDITWALIGADIAKRPYITVGFTGFVLMIPLAITSTAGWIRRIGDHDVGGIQTSGGVQRP